MLNFDVERYRRIQSGAAGLALEIDEAVSGLVAEGLDHVVFAGTGGAAILMRPAADLLRDASRLRTSTMRCAEMVAAPPSSIRPGTLVILPSLSGTTAETIEASGICRAAGAHVMALVGDASSPLARAADTVLTNAAADDTSSESFYIQSLLIAVSVLKHTDGPGPVPDLAQDLTQMPEALLRVKEWFEPRADPAARYLASGRTHIITGAGPSWPEAWYYGMCILEEMQWISTRPVHASDFFHGTLELVQPGVSVVVCAGEGPSRALTDRVQRFGASLTDQMLVIDVANAPLDGISATSRPYLAPILLAAVLERVSAHLEVITGHPLTTRRYYRRMEY